jgi:hypothetical protein
MRRDNNITLSGMGIRWRDSKIGWRELGMLRWEKGIFINGRVNLAKGDWEYGGWEGE